MSFLTKGISQFYKDLLHTDNSNTGVSSSLKQIKCGDGDATALYLSTRGVNVRPASDTTGAVGIMDADGNALFKVDSTNDLVKAGIGQHIVNTQIQSFGMFDFSPTAGNHHPLTTSSFMNSVGADDYTALVNAGAWGGSGTNPATTLTVASVAEQFIPSVFLLQQNITIDEIQYMASADASTTANIHVMSYTMQTGSGATAGDLTEGAVIAQTGSASDSLSPVTLGDDRVSNGTLTINTSDIADGKALVIFAENVGGTDDITLQVNLKYHLR